MLIYSNIFIWGSEFLTSVTLYKFLKTFTMPNLRKKEITIDFNGTWVIIGVWLLINCMVNVAETFTDILKHYFLQTNFVKFAKCML